MFFIVFVLNAILVTGLLAVDPGYYIDSSISNEKMYFPKSDTEYIDYLIEKGGVEANYELAIAHLKLGREDIAGKYISLYEKEEYDLQKLIKYYRLSGDYVKVEEILGDLLKEVDKETEIKYKILIERETKARNLPIDLEKYQVSNIEKLYVLRDNDEKFKIYFNSEQWTEAQMAELIEMVKYEKIQKGSSLKKLFEMFATDRDRLHKKYLEINDGEDVTAYTQYFEYADELGLKPEIKSQQEKDYYQKYKGEVIEVENINVEITGDKDPESEEVDFPSTANIDEYEQEIQIGKLDRLDEYTDLLRDSGIKDVESKLKELTREAYVAYRLDRNLSVEEGDKSLAATYLFETNDLVKLDRYKEYLSEEQLGLLAIRNKRYKEYYREKYPLNSENIDRREQEYFYFAENPQTSEYIVRQLNQKRHLEPQERYYLAVHYNQKRDYVKSYRETEELFRRYKLSDGIFNLHAENIEKLKGVNSDEPPLIDTALSIE